MGNTEHMGLEHITFSIKKAHTTMVKAMAHSLRVSIAKQLEGELEQSAILEAIEKIGGEELVDRVQLEAQNDV